jgi:hypothetical protein
MEHLSKIDHVTPASGAAHSAASAPASEAAGVDPVVSHGAAAGSPFAHYADDDLAEVAAQANQGDEIDDLLPPDRI